MRSLAGTTGVAATRVGAQAFETSMLKSTFALRAHCGREPARYQSRAVTDFMYCRLNPVGFPYRPAALACRAILLPPSQTVPDGSDGPAGVRYPPAPECQYLSNARRLCRSRSFSVSSLNKDRAVNAGEVFALFVPLLHYHGRYIRNFFLGRLQDLLAHDFRNHGAHRLIGQIIFLKQRLTLREDA